MARRSLKGPLKKIHRVIGKEEEVNYTNKWELHTGLNRRRTRLEDSVWNEIRCCLCHGSHPADYSNCPARAQEASVLEIIEKRSCSRGEAIPAVKERARSYASVASRQDSVSEQSLSTMINASVVNSMTSIVQPLVSSLSECMCQMQAVTQKMAEFVQVFSTLPSSCQMVPAGVAHTPGASSGKTSLLANAGLAAASVPPTSVYLAHLPLPAALPGDPKGTPLTQQPHMSSPSGEKVAAPQQIEQFISHQDASSPFVVEGSDDIDVGQSTSLSQKRRLSPTHKETIKPPKPKNNKNPSIPGQPSSQSHDILPQAISSAQLG